MSMPNLAEGRPDLGLAGVSRYLKATGRHKVLIGIAAWAKGFQNGAALALLHRSADAPQRA